MTYYCSNCRRPVTREQVANSLRNFDLILCRDCQAPLKRKAKNAAQKRSWKGGTGIEIGSNLPTTKKTPDGYW